MFREQKSREFGMMADARVAVSKEKTVTIFGDSKKEGAWGVPEEMQVITIFGSINIKIQRTFREKLLNFAETVRVMFATPAR